jgi:hypothetical protein
MFSFIMLSVPFFIVRQSVVMLNVVWLEVVALIKNKFLNVI